MDGIDPSQVTWDAPAAPDSSKIDPSTIQWDSPGSKATLGAIAGRVKNQGRATDMMLATTGQAHPPVQKLGRLPFMQQATLAAMDNPAEGRALLEQLYGKGSVTKDKHGFLVKDKDGKMIRASSSFIANLVAEAPETMLGIAGGIAGFATGGPLGAIAGAAAGAGAGKTIKEGAKAVTGTYRKTPGTYVKGVERAMEGGAIGEITGQAGKAVAKGIGRAWRWYEGVTPEISANTARYVAGGARPLPQYSLPDAKYIQRVYILKEKISGPSKGMESANKQFMQGEVSKILNKAGFSKAAKSTTQASLENTASRISTTDTGRAIQSSSKVALQQLQFGTPLGKAAKSTTKTTEYLKQLAAEGVTPEDAYTHLVHGGSTDMLEKFIAAVGKDSPAVKSIQHQALKDLLAESMMRTKDKGVVDSLTRGLKGMTDGQKELLFPGGLAKDIERLDQDLHNIFPGGMDTSAAAITAGAILQRPLLGKIIHGADRERIFHSRLAAQLYYGTLHLLLQQPATIHTLAVGLRPGSPTRAASKIALKELAYFGAIEASEPTQQEQPTR